MSPGLCGSLRRRGGCGCIERRAVSSACRGSCQRDKARSRPAPTSATASRAIPNRCLRFMADASCGCVAVRARRSHRRGTEKIQLRPKARGHPSPVAALAGVRRSRCGARAARQSMLALAAAVGGSVPPACARRRAAAVACSYRTMRSRSLSHSSIIARSSAARARATYPRARLAPDRAWRAWRRAPGPAGWR